MFDFLSKHVISSLKDQDKEIIAEDGQQVLCVPTQEDLVLLVPCNHEEVNTHSMFYATRASQSHQKIRDIACPI